MEQRDKGFPKMIPNKNWSLSGLEELIKKLLTTQVLCGQCEVDHYPIRRTIEQQYLCCQFFDQRFQSTKTPVFVSKHLSNLFAPYFLFSGKDLIKYLSSVLMPRSRRLGSRNFGVQTRK